MLIFSYKLRFWLLARQLFCDNCSLTQLVLTCQLGKKAYGASIRDMPDSIQDKIQLFIQEINRRIMRNERWAEVVN
jgi:hypothetical protein